MDHEHPFNAKKIATRSSHQIYCGRFPCNNNVSTILDAMLSAVTLSVTASGPSKEAWPKGGIRFLETEYAYVVSTQATSHLAAHPARMIVLQSEAAINLNLGRKGHR